MSDSPFGFDKPHDSPGFLLWQTSTIWQRQIKQALAEYDLTHAQFVIMALILWLNRNQQEPTQVDITELSKLDKMTTSKSLTDLHNRGYVARNERAEDTRAKHLSLTDKGRKLLNTIVPVVEDIDARFFNALSEDDAARMNNYLLQVVTHHTGI